MTGILMIMFATFLWALDTLIRYPLLAQGYGTLEIVLIENLILFLIALPFLWRARMKFLSLNKTQWLAFIVIGGLGSAIGNLAFTHAFSVLNPSLVILLQKLQPVVAALLAFLLLKERLGPWFLGALGMCIGGSTLMIAPGIQAMFSNGSFAYTSENIAVVVAYGATLTAVISWGAATVFGKKLSNSGLNSTDLMAGRFSIGFAFLLIISIASPGNQFSHVTEVNFIGPIVVMVVVAGLLGMYFYYQGLSRTKSSIAALAEMFFPVAAVMLNWLVLDASLNFYEISGAFVLVAGSMLAQYQDQKNTPVLKGVV